MTSDTLNRWMLLEGPACSDLGQLVRGFTQRLHRAGVPVDRAFLGPLILHPQAAGIAIIFERPDDTLRAFSLSHERYEALHARKGAPMTHIIDSQTPLRARLSDGEDLGMADLVGLKEQGYTDFLALPVRVGGRLRAGITLATRSPEGFSAAATALIETAIETLGPIMMLFVQQIEQRSLLRAYLGADAGERVQRGQVRRGEGQTIRAAICFSDMRGFTRLSSDHPRDVVLGLLNAVFAVQVHHVEAHGGQVLKFMGDGMLSIFSAPDGPRACASALEAAQQALVGLAALNRQRVAQGEPTTGVGFGLHYGDVMYGNIGAPQRLDFTVIGAAVNLTARIESCCGALGRSILMSETFAANIPGGAVSCGHHDLKGVAEAVELFSSVGG